MAINDNTAKWKVRKLTNLQVGSNGYWQPNEEVKVGTIRFPQGRENVGYILECVEAGTTGEEQPTLIGEELANYAEVGRVGQVRVIFNLAEKDVDEVMAMGITYSRLTYPELWEWAGKRAGLVISEEEWQAKFAETNGKFVPYYSSGDGSSTFRTPLLGAYLKGAETSSEVGKYVDAGLPNILGYITSPAWLTFVNSTATGLIATGAFSETVKGGTLAATQDSSAIDGGDLDIHFNAQKSNAIYGNSDTVTPETMTGVWVIKAVGVVVDSGETDIAQALSDLENIQSRYLPLSGGNITGNLSINNAQIVTAIEAGDVIGNIGGHYAGLLSGGNKSLNVILPMNRPINANSATLTGTFTVRQNGKYLAQNYSLATYVDNIYFRSNCIHFSLYFGTALADSTNNDVCNVQLHGDTVLTFS